MAHIKTQKKAIELSDEAKIVFNECKRQLANVAFLAHPSSNSDLVLCVDGSDFAIGGSLNQMTHNKLQPLGFFSRKLSETEKGYSTYDRELLAVFAGIKHFQYMLERRQFCIYTDH